VIGALGPAALKAMLHADEVLARSSLCKQDQETIKLLVSELSGCDYCAAAHTQLAKTTGPLTCHREADSCGPAHG
jgi:AhpD family alkylhydroperoxidase